MTTVKKTLVWLVAASLCITGFVGLSYIVSGETTYVAVVSYWVYGYLCGKPVAQLYMWMSDSYPTTKYYWQQ